MHIIRNQNRKAHSARTSLLKLLKRSVIGYGRAFLVEDIDEKRLALDVIIEHYSGQTGEYAEKLVDRLAVIKVEIESMTGKKSGG